MENSFETSFIPKKSVGNTNVVKAKVPVSIFNILTLLIMIAVIVASFGFYLYRNYLTNQKNVLSQNLAQSKAYFDQATINELESFDKKVGTAKELLNNHVILSPIFSTLSAITLPTVQYKSFSHQTADKTFSVNLSGTAVDYRSVALQADAFNSKEGSSFHNVVFSNLTKNKDGNIDFNISFDVDPTLLSYEKNISANQITQP